MLKKRLLAAAATIGLVVGMIAAPAGAAINTISVALDNPLPSGTAAYTWTWSGYQTAAAVYCVKVQMSINADGTGGIPTGMGLASTTLTGTYGGTWTRDATSAATGTVVFNWATGVTPAAGPRTLILGAVTNPSTAAGGTYYETITTYSAVGTGSSGACGGSVRDASTVAAWETTQGQTASVTIDPSLGLVINTVLGSTACGDATTTLASTTNTVDLGHITSTASHPIAGQSLNVTTNAANGYTVYLSSSTTNLVGAVTARNFVNWTGSNATPTTWPSAGTEAFGYHSAASNLATSATRFQTNKWAALSTTGSEVMRNTTTPAGAGDNNCIAYQAQSASATPADTYSTTLRYNLVAVF